MTQYEADFYRVIEKYIPEISRSLKEIANGGSSRVIPIEWLQKYGAERAEAYLDDRGLYSVNDVVQWVIYDYIYERHSNGE